MRLKPECRRCRLSIVVLATTLGIPIGSLAEWVTVARVYDGDTFLTEGGVKVRVRGIDTPETHHPEIGREAGGEAATALAKYYLEGNRVYLTGTAKDRYGRRLADVRLEDRRDYADIVRAKGYDKRTRKSADGKDEMKPGKFMQSKRIWVKGYFREDGTWVSGHFRRIRK